MTSFQIRVQLMEYCLIKNLAKENPVGKNFSEGKKSAVYS